MVRREIAPTSQALQVAFSRLFREPMLSESTSFGSRWGIYEMSSSRSVLRTSPVQSSPKLIVAGALRGYVAIISATDARYYRRVLYPLTSVARVRAAGGLCTKGSGRLASVDDRKETSLRACVAHMLDIDVSEVPTKREANIGQWLALRNLGLVPVASPESFEWPGRFLGLRSDSSTWAVFFGVPPGIIYDPLAEPDEEKQDTTVDAAFVLAKHDPRRGTEPGSGTDSVGVIELIALASEAEDSMRAVSSAEAVEGRGLLGDRYERKAGTFSNPKGSGYDLTLVEAEALEELSAKGVELSPIEARRNLVVRGIA